MSVHKLETDASFPQSVERESGIFSNSVCPVKDLSHDIRSKLLSGSVNYADPAANANHHQYPLQKFPLSQDSHGPHPLLSTVYYFETAPAM